MKIILTNSNNIISTINGLLIISLDLLMDKKI